MLKVLIVDDDADLLEMVGMVLSNSGMSVEAADNGSAVLEMVERTAPDILVMDVFLGDADGRNVCHELKTSKHKHLPVILYSAGIIPPDTLRTAMVDDFLAKPFKIDELIFKIKRLTPDVN